MAKNTATAPRADIYDRVTETIITALEQARSPQDWPWVRAARQGAPINFQSKKAYRGINRLMLGLAVQAGASRYWGTFNQWKAAGAMVRKGEKGSLVVYYGEIWKDEAGHTVEKGTAGAKKVLYAKGSTVFNASQVDGWTAPATTTQTNEAAELEAAEGAQTFEQVEAFIAATGAIIHEQGDAAFYMPGMDAITMPTRDRFRDTAAADATTHFYGTLCHELVHWTGHSKRCARDFTGKFGDKAYAIEELVAEIGSAFLCADLGLSPMPREDNVAYVANWLQVLKNDKKQIVSASAASARACDYLHSLQDVIFSPDEGEDTTDDEAALMAEAA